MEHSDTVWLIVMVCSVTYIYNSGVSYYNLNNFSLAFQCRAPQNQHVAKKGKETEEKGKCKSLEEAIDQIHILHIGSSL